MRTARYAAVTMGILFALATAAATLFIYSGFYNIAATSQHSAPVYWLLETAKLRSIQRRATDIETPDLTPLAVLERGLQHFRHHCVQCHGAPGVAPDDFAKGLQPGAPPLAQVAREWAPAEIYWVIERGIKMTAMPAWRYRLDSSDIWAIVAFLRTLPMLSPADYGRMVEHNSRVPYNAPQVTSLMRPGDAAQGKVALQQYACVSCHEIPGIVGPAARVGPTLAGMARRGYIAGVLVNTPQNMLLWLRYPHQVKPFTAMPDMGVAEAHARAMAAYLYTLR
jgi:mono/diheme cytochrome c family protein